jgi:hypothetical protein
MATVKEKDENKSDNDDLDAVFKLPLTEFTAARNALAARLKKAGRREDADRVKALGKPPISAWAVNQLYWDHRHLFDQLIAAGENFGRAHASQLAGKPVDVRGPLAARREVISSLAALASALLRDAGHNPTPDIMRRIATTLEALSIYSSLPDAPHAGRLTDDIDPPGFESLAALFPSVERKEKASEPPTPSPPIALAKAALEAAERVLRETRAKSEELEMERRNAEERFAKATAAAEEARQRLQNVRAQADEAARLLEAAEHDLERARREHRKTELSQTGM